jgi:hypothetical protein
MMMKKMRRNFMKTKRKAGLLKRRRIFAIIQDPLQNNSPQTYRSESKSSLRTAMISRRLPKRKKEREKVMMTLGPKMSQRARERVLVGDKDVTNVCHLANSTRLKKTTIVT